jgi:hypothetical protein
MRQIHIEAEMVPEGNPRIASTRETADAIITSSPPATKIRSATPQRQW